MKERCDGYIKAHHELGLEVNQSLIKYISNDRAIHEIHDFIDSVRKEADAYFFANNEIALIAIKYLMQSSDTHKEVDIACFDDHEAFHLLNTSIGIVTQPVAEMGKVALKILLDNIEGKPDSTQTITLSTQYKLLNEQLVKK